MHTTLRIRNRNDILLSLLLRPFKPQQLTATYCLVSVVGSCAFMLLYRVFNISLLSSWTIVLIGALLAIVGAVIVEAARDTELGRAELIEVKDLCVLTEVAEVIRAYGRLPTSIQWSDLKDQIAIHRKASVLRYEVSLEQERHDAYRDIVGR